MRGCGTVISDRVDRYPPMRSTYMGTVMHALHNLTATHYYTLALSEEENKKFVDAIRNATGLEGAEAMSGEALIHRIIGSDVRECGFKADELQIYAAVGPSQRSIDTAKRRMGLNECKLLRLVSLVSSVTRDMLLAKGCTRDALASLTEMRIIGVISSGNLARLGDGDDRLYITEFGETVAKQLRREGKLDAHDLSEEERRST